VKKRIDETIASLDKVKAHQLQGSNNPLLKAQATYGVWKHDDMQKSCDAKEILISCDYCKNPHPKRYARLHARLQVGGDQAGFAEGSW
jgi:hypothetical protein